MTVTLYEGGKLSMKWNTNTFPRKLLYNNVEYFLGNEVGAYCGLTHGKLYEFPIIRLNRILLTPRMRDQLRVQVILINIMCMLWVHQSKQFFTPPFSFL